MVTGSDGRWDGNSAELLNINGTKLCALPNLPAARNYHSQTGLLTCGGGTRSSEQKSCVKFSGGEWKKTHNLGIERFGHTAWASPLGVLLVGNSVGSSVTDKERMSSKTTELLTDNGDTKSSFTLADRMQ